MFCKPCSLSRNRSLRDAKSARHLFVWFAKHCLAEHCLLFRGDADEFEKQFCFVFRICLAFFDSRLRRALGELIVRKSNQQKWRLSILISSTSYPNYIRGLRHVRLHLKYFIDIHDKARFPWMCEHARWNSNYNGFAMCISAWKRPLSIPRFGFSVHWNAHVSASMENGQELPADILKE